MLGIFTGRSGLNNGTAQPLGEMHTTAAHICSGVFPHLEGFRVIEKIDTDLFQQNIRIVLDQLQVFFTEILDIGDFALDKWLGCSHCIGPCLAAPFSATSFTPRSSSTCSFSHNITSSAESMTRR